MVGRDPKRYDDALHDWTDAESVRRFDAHVRRRRWRRRILVGLVAFAVLVTGGAVAADVIPRIWYQHDVYNKQYLIGKYGYQLSDPARAQLFGALPRLESFVEHQRGGHFLHPVKLQFIADDYFFGVWGTPRTVDTSDAVALGFAKTPADVAHQLTQLQDIDVPGFYDFREHVLNIRGQAFDDYAQVMLVHELTHAYDDQHFNLTGFRDKRGDAFDAASSLVEGDATAVQNAFTETLPLGERCLQLTDTLQPYDAACRAASYGPHNQEQQLSHWGLQAETVFPSIMGARFIDALARSGGQRAVDDAFRRPPTTTAEIIDPAAYVNHAAAVAVPGPPRPTGARRAPHRLGAMQLSALVTDGFLGVGTTRYVHGWRGDSAVTYPSKGGSCLAVNVALATPRDADDLATTAAHWRRAKAHRTATRVSPTIVQLVRCTG